MMDFYNPATDGSDYKPAIDRALIWYSANRTGHKSPAWGDEDDTPEELAAKQAGIGTGVIELPRGQFTLGGDQQIIMASVQGAGLRGHGIYSTTLKKNTDAVSSGIYMEGYVGVFLEDFTLINESGNPGGSFGVFLNSNVGGGGTLRLNRLHIEGFHVGIQIAPTATVDGDKTLYTQITLICDVGWSNGQNRQAMSHTFVGLNAGCKEATFRYGGAGTLYSLQSTVNIEGVDPSYLKRLRARALCKRLHRLPER